MALAIPELPSVSMPKSIYSKQQELLCELLIEARLEAGLTQQEVADALGHSQSYVAKIEGGERRLDVIEFIDLCGRIDTNPIEVMRALLKS